MRVRKTKEEKESRWGRRREGGKLNAFLDERFHSQI